MERRVTNNDVQESFVKAWATARRCLPPEQAEQVTQALQDSHQKYLDTKSELDRNYQYLMGLLKNG